MAVPQVLVPDLYPKFKAPLPGCMVEPVVPPSVKVAEIEALPVGAPRFKLVAAPAKFKVVVVVLNRLRVVALVLIVGALKAIKPFEPLFGERVIYPVVLPPMIRGWFLVV
jgi:hypothetical protein